MAARLQAVLAEARRRLRAAGFAEADLDARLLVADTLGTDAAGLILRADDIVDAPTQATIEARLERRLAGEPVHRILGRRAFYDHVFALSPETLEPRPDTEALVELCRTPIERVIAARGTCTLVDVGTGSGAIAVSLLALYPALTAVATDLSPGALRTARGNAEAARVGHRFHPVVADYLAGVGGAIDIVVSNPPYIESDEIAALEIGVRDFDPRLALDGGADGLDAYRALAAEASALLPAHGHALMEIGQDQASRVCEIFAGNGLDLAASASDLSGTTRALWFRPAE